VEFYNDSKATSVDATAKALATFDHGVWLILGGEDKGAPYTPLAEELKRKGRAVLTIGAAADKIARDLNGAAPLIAAGTLDNAVRRAFAAAQPGDTVLLAPACASFDQFTSFEHRGRTFKEIVSQLQKGATHGA
jgi:UDP-N-acetylmuramoylalanine--D-glutamate ligase